MTRWLLDPSGLRASNLTPPLSKSDAQRALVLSFALGQPSWRQFAHSPSEALPDDVRVVAGAVETMKPSEEFLTVDCGDGGAPFRLLLTQAAVTPGLKVRFTGSRRLGERPHQPLLDALRSALGPSGLVLHEGSPWPIEVVAPPRTGEPRFVVSGQESSQFVSSLLLGACGLCLREGRPWSVETTGPLASAGYLELTLDWMRRCGVEFSRDGGRFTVSRVHPSTRAPEVPGDWSALGYLLLIAWKTGGTALRVDPTASHPDREVLSQLASVGLSVELDAGRARVRGAPHGGLNASASSCPDLLPTLAALACTLDAPSVFTEVEILRKKESDRLEGIISLVEAAGGSTTLTGSQLRIDPPRRVREPFEIDSRGDHRMAMSAATLSVLSGARLLLTGPECVAKSFPGFWNELSVAGLGFFVS